MGYFTAESRDGGKMQMRISFSLSEEEVEKRRRDGRQASEIRNILVVIAERCAVAKMLSKGINSLAGLSVSSVPDVIASSRM